MLKNIIVLHTLQKEPNMNKERKGENIHYECLKVSYIVNPEFI